jgi:hypothetical protein
VASVRANREQKIAVALGADVIATQQIFVFAEQNSTYPGRLFSRVHEKTPKITCPPVLAPDQQRSLNDVALLEPADVSFDARR